MNNKRLGTAFEQEFCDLLSSKGYWVHFIVPDIRGTQPFDVIAAKNGYAYAFDCKTCASNVFSMNRLEDNQISAFELWLKCGNTEPMIAVKHKGYVYILNYSELKKTKSIRLSESTKCILL